ncbi:leucine-rich repeat domain-containing protein [Clostridium tagluense]|uniref:leucine-rich repeat domain-containing protein n=1 Tax=Clostridium tagluense TaxID=360422 RepID=UPI001CF33220|nr:leucine-rich repeat domain-containing protein [Clostridium tagluense]MCB2314152.1 leucine-rich repeat domain-containing protein [Clostridium tagluense]MCB2318979.1 leucine-rich repeat domain-containing protein [Clostridium tagluense]MCB2323885.1 leucine-rich repeat domain-containing protein [Clostridium tagluense]MCB2328710.1 leucine-rich repeat domain-containing protein [Clostridium tagluense]MCB2333615.1 leucine-rich repeat domain-containing protein [Clostridium tagluense]
MNKSKSLSNTYIKIILIAIIIIGAFSVFQYKKYLDTNVIIFKNENFEKLVRMTIHKPKGHIFKKDLENIKKLQASSGKISDSFRSAIQYKITDLNGIEYFKNLETVSLARNDITNISPLSKLSKLKHLDLSSNLELADISPLSKLLNLEYLDISSIKKLTNISPLSKLTKLEYLDAIGNKIKDVSPLSALPNIKTLKLSINEIEDISSLNKLSSLTNLHLGANKIKDVKPLSNMTHLKVLHLEKNPIDDFSPLDSLKSVDIRKELI